MGGNKVKQSSPEGDTSSQAQAHGKAMTGQELRDWGLTKVAYLRSITHQGTPLIVIYAADGTPVALAEDEDSAVDVILEQEMEPTFLH